LIWVCVGGVFGCQLGVGLLHGQPSGRGLRAVAVPLSRPRTVCGACGGELGRACAGKRGLQVVVLPVDISAACPAVQALGPDVGQADEQPLGHVTP
jgi:hypothetical protein